jgi:hypothetical protein
MIHTYNEYHLGDQLIHLNFLRKVCEQEPHQEFVHHCNPQYHNQLQPLCEGVPILLDGLHIPPGSINAWIGHCNFFYEHPHRRNWLLVHQAWFDRLSSVMGVSNPMAGREDYLFDYPALKEPTRYEFDYLIINSPPQSGQLPDYNPKFFTNLVRNLTNEGLKVITTAPTGMCPSTLEWNFDVSMIGALSKSCTHIIGIDTGPLWTTFNVYNLDTVKSRLIYGTTFDKFGLTDNIVVRQTLSEK